MKRDSRSSSGSDRPRGTRPTVAPLIAVAGLLIATGCTDAMMKKFVRQPKAQPRPSPIVQFDEYAASTSPLDLYRKHATVFEYWNAELLDALLPTANNSKRVKRASQESLRQLEAMVQLLADASAGQVQPLLEERRKLDRQLQDQVDDHAQAALLRQSLELQQRRLHRYMAVGKVTDHLRAAASTVPRVAVQTSPAPGAAATDAQ